MPTYLSSVTALQSLHIAANNIGDGSSACLSHLTALTKLVMQQCKLSVVPESLAALSRLKWLCLSRNRLGSIPEGLPWQQLEVLHLRGNELRCVPCESLSKAVSLEVLDCGENQPLQVTFFYNFASGDDGHVETGQSSMYLRSSVYNMRNFWAHVCTLHHMHHLACAHVIMAVAPDLLLSHSNVTKHLIQ